MPTIQDMVGDIWKMVRGGGLPVGLAGESHIGGVGGHSGNMVGATQRPSDTTQYGAGEVVGSMITFVDAGRVVGGSGWILGGILIDSANAATVLQSEVWLFDRLTTAAADNTAFSVTDAQMANFIGLIQFLTPFIGLATADAAGNLVNNGTLTNYIAYKCATDSKDLYGILITRNTYTPYASELFTIKLRIAQD